MEMPLFTSSNKKRVITCILQMETINEFLAECNVMCLDCSTLSPEQIDAVCKIISGDLTNAMQDGYTMAFSGLYLEKNKDIVHPVNAEQYYKSAFDVGKIPRIGFYYCGIEEYDLALQYLTKCDKTIHVMKAIGYCYHWQKNCALSLKYYKMALEYDVNDAEALSFIGFACSKLNNYEDAEYYFVRCKNCDASVFRTNFGYYRLAYSYAKQKRCKLAISCYAKFVDETDDDNLKGCAYAEMATCYDNINECELAEEHYLNATKYKNVNAHFALGNLYGNQTRYRLAKQQYELALENGYANKTMCQTRLDYVNVELDKRNKAEIAEITEKLPYCVPKNDAILPVQTTSPTKVVCNEANHSNNLTNMFYSIKSVIFPEKQETPTLMPTVVCDGNNELIPLIDKNKQHEE